MRTLLYLASIGIASFALTEGWWLAGTAWLLTAALLALTAPDSPLRSEEDS